MASTHSLVLSDPTATSEKVKAAGFRTGFLRTDPRGLERSICACSSSGDEHRLGLFDVTRTQIELYVREVTASAGRQPRRRAYRPGRLLRLRRRGDLHWVPQRLVRWPNFLVYTPKSEVTVPKEGVANERRDG